ncbi:hypothetical protein F5882DRAFT_379909 [Hyaloscypha sp. PMI_1271]|nr:hypothetical protein F5882DRAFT_379909 [Hyaloscypha sp. PMI_1271]
MKLFDMAFSLVWVAVATAHGGIYTYNIPARYVKEPGSIFGTMDISTVTKVMGFRTGSAASNGAVLLANTRYQLREHDLQFRWLGYERFFACCRQDDCNHSTSFMILNSESTPVAHWFGPLLVYMARCPGSSCGGFDGKEAIGSRSHSTDLLPRH